MASTGNSNLVEESRKCTTEGGAIGLIYGKQVGAERPAKFLNCEFIDIQVIASRIASLMHQIFPAEIGPDPI